MHFALLCGVSQYDNVTYYMRDLVDGLRELGHEVTSVGSDKNISDVLATPCEAYITFNAVQVAAQYPGRHWLDQSGKPMLTWLVDHPAGHLCRLQSYYGRPDAGRLLLVATVCQSHLDYISASIPRRVPRAFLPHFGSVVAPPAPWAERKNLIIMPGSMPEPAHRMLEKIKTELPAALVETCLDAIGFAMADPSRSPHAALRDAFLERGVVIEHSIMMNEPALLNKCDNYVRAARREAILDHCRKAGITVDLFGNIDASIPALAGHRVHGPISYPEILALMSQVKVVINTGAGFYHGSHERLVSAMINGALCFTEETAWLASAFPEGIRPPTFSWTDPGPGCAALRALLANDAAAGELANLGRLACEKAHSRTVRAQQYLDCFDNLRVLIGV